MRCVKVVKTKLKFSIIYFWVFFVLTEAENNNKAAEDWWCDETECFYRDAIPNEDNCDSSKSIPYRLNTTTGMCELNLVALLLSFRVLNNRLGAIVEVKNRKRSELIFQGIINSGKMFIGFTSVCVFLGCFYCCWVPYSDRQLRKSLKVAEKKVLAQHTNKTKVNVGKNINEEIVKPDKCTTREELFDSVV